MYKYKIEKKTRQDKVWYEAKKRFLGFLWWFNYNDDGFYSDGTFSTLEEAIKDVESMRAKTKTEVVKLYK